MSQVLLVRYLYRFCRITWLQHQQSYRTLIFLPCGQMETPIEHPKYWLSEMAVATQCSIVFPSKQTSRNTWDRIDLPELASQQTQLLWKMSWRSCSRDCRKDHDEIGQSKPPRVMFAGMVKIVKVLVFNGETDSTVVWQWIERTLGRTRASFCIECGR